MHSPRQIAIVLFGGSGVRFGSVKPKQFVLIGSRPMMAETLLGVFQCECVDEIYVVSRKDLIQESKDLIDHFHIGKVKAIIPGGETRRESVLHALEYLYAAGVSDKDLILIHDGDRPNVNPEIFEANYKEAKAHGAAVTAVGSTNSIIYSQLGMEVDSYQPRQMIFQAQTPQTFRFDLIYKAHKKANASSTLSLYTDDASLVKATKHKVRIVPGEECNVKITTKLDVATYLEGRRLL